MLMISAVYLQCNLAMFLTVLPERSTALFTRPYVPFPRLCWNSYRCLRLCLWWCLFTAWRFAAESPEPTESPGARADPPPSIVHMISWAATHALVLPGASEWRARWSPGLARGTCGRGSVQWAWFCQVGVALTGSTALALSPLFAF